MKAEAGRASGGAGAGAGSGGTGGARSETGMIELVPNVIAGQQLAAAGGTAGIGSSGSALRIGSPSASNLLSLKYYVTSIRLCEDVELQGSGYNNARGCIDLYMNMDASSPSYDTYTVMAAKDDTTPGRYVDLMSREGQAALRRPVRVQVPIASDAPARDADSDAGAADGGVDDQPQRGVYRYGLINFYRPIKVKAEFPIIGDPAAYYRTRAVTAIHPTMFGERVDIGDTTSGPTEETTYMLNNGGALFVFQKPFVITQADVDAKAAISIDLVFNPDSFGQAYESMCANDQHVAICDPVHDVAIDMPFVHMSPVPRKTGERTRKETYLVEYDANAKLRIELYYNDADPNKSVQGVDTAIVYDTTAAPSGNTPSMNIVSSHFVEERGSVVRLLDYRRMLNLDGLRRRERGRAVIHCLYTGGICPTAGGTVEKAYEYQGDTVVSGD